MDERDLDVRNATYRLFVELGRAPTSHDVAGATSSSTADVVESWRRLHDAHALVLHQGRDEIRMANPFSAVPTAHRVEAGGRSWYASCAWDAFGICAALQSDGRIRTACPDCGDDIDVTVVDRAPSDDSLLFHCLVPADTWWDDIGFT